MNNNIQQRHQPQSQQINCNKGFNKSVDEIMQNAQRTQNYTNIQEILKLFETNYNKTCHGNTSSQQPKPQKHQPQQHNQPQQKPKPQKHQPQKHNQQQHQPQQYQPQQQQQPQQPHQHQHQQHQHQPKTPTIIPTSTATATPKPKHPPPYPYKTDYQYIQAIYSGEAKTNPLTGELEIIKKKPFSFDINEKKNIIIALGFGILYNIFFIFWGFKMINFYYKRGESAKDYYNYGWSYIILNIIFSIIMILIIVNFYMKNPFLNDETIVFLQIFIIINALINIFVPASHWHFILNI
jgi:hypothetical protein